MFRRIIMPFIKISDLPDPNDPQGRSYKEVNLAKQHVHKIGDRVSINLFVTGNTRDCDGTPLYNLSYGMEDTKPDIRNLSGDSIYVLKSNV